MCGNMAYTGHSWATSLQLRLLAMRWGHQNLENVAISSSETKLFLNCQSSFIQASKQACVHVLNKARVEVYRRVSGLCLHRNCNSHIVFIQICLYLCNPTQMSSMTPCPLRNWTCRHSKGGKSGWAASVKLSAHPTLGEIRYRTGQFPCHFLNVCLNLFMTFTRLTFNISTVILPESAGQWS